MCGITGIWNIKGEFINKGMFDQFTDSLAHRGPDGRGVYFDPKCSLALGHRRLAILDLSSSGHQPMSYANGRYWITYNGEIYNFLELREELEASGHYFISHSDTEIILAAYIQWGEDCQLRFNGMWAFAIWDSRERTLFLSRDRFGIKPLHYISTDRYFAFASEMKAFLVLDCYDYAIDHDILAETLSNINGLEGSEHTILRGVKHLIGGHCLKMRKGSKPDIRRWWNTLDHLVEPPVRFEDQAEHFRELFIDSCRLRMRSDVPLATSLSGGLDSSAVLCTMHSIGQHQGFTKDWQKAFVACFPGTELDEQQYARQVIEATKAIPVYTEIKIEDCIPRLEKIVYQLEDINWVFLAGLWKNYKTMRDNGIVVSMDGHGSDELLGGYHFIIEDEMRNALSPWPKLGHYLELKKILEGFTGGSNPIRPSLIKDLLILMCRHKQWPLVMKALYPLRSVYRFLKRGHSAPDSFISHFIKEQKLKLHEKMLEKDELAGLSHLNRNLYAYFHDTVLPSILRNFDRASMAHGVEIRMPFMDWRIVCFGFSLPDESKIGGGYAKRILRESMRNIIPDQIRLRTNKIGFTSPMDKWFKGPLRGFLLDSVNSRNFLLSDIWDGSALKNFVELSLEKQDYSSLERAWPFLNAHLLVKQFDLQRSRYCSDKQTRC